MKSPSFYLTLGALLILAAGGFAADRFATLRGLRTERQEAQEALRKAVALAGEHPRAFGHRSGPSSADSSLKALVQETATLRGVALGYLSESEREGEKGMGERQVLLRLMNAPHPNVVFFLQDLEARGSGAKVKELHVRPSREIPDAYEEVEIVLSKSFARNPEKKP